MTAGAPVPLAPAVAGAAVAGLVAFLLSGRPRAAHLRLQAAGSRGGGRPGESGGPGTERSGVARATTGRVCAAVAGCLGGYLGVLLLLSEGPLGQGGPGQLSPARLASAVAARLVGLGVPGAAPAAALAVAVAVRARRRTRRSVAQVRRRRAVIDGVLVLAAELRAGTPALPALQAAAQSASVLGPPAAVAALGGDVAASLRAVGRQQGSSGLSWLAAAWTVSAEMGAALAETVEELVEILRAEDLAREETESALASTRATARLLCALPLAGLGLGSAIGGHPWRVLTGTPWGPALAVVAVLLAAAGLEWVERLAASAADPGVRGREVR